MDVFFLTGAGTEPAQSIARRLVSAGSRVYGFDARFPEQGFQNADFIPVPLDMTDIAAVRTAASKILATETILSGVIFAAGQTVEDPFESTHPDDISLALVSGLVAPLLLARMALPSLVRCRGHIIAITNDTPGQDGTVLNATVAGALREFTRTLFEELRDTGTKTAHLRIGHNTGRTDPAARTTQTPQSEVQPDIVADTVLTLLRLRENNALTELVLRPQATRETPRLPVTADPRLRAIQVVQLPLPQHFPPPDEAIYTPPRKRPDYAPPPGSEDALPEDDEDSADIDPELLYLLKPEHRQAEPPQQPRPQRQERPRPPVQQEPVRQQQDTRPPAQQQDGRQGRRRGAVLRIHPRLSDEQPGRQEQRRQEPPQSNQRPPQQPRNEAPANPQQTPPYPEGWNGPRPPTRRQLERIWHQQKEQQRRERGASFTGAAPAPDRQTPSGEPREYLPPRIPAVDDTPPVIAQKPEPVPAKLPDETPAPPETPVEASTANPPPPNKSGQRPPAKKRPVKKSTPPAEKRPRAAPQARKRPSSSELRRRLPEE